MKLVGLAIAVLTVLCLMGIQGCGKRNDSIIGEWEREEVGRVAVLKEHLKIERVRFTARVTCVANDGASVSVEVSANAQVGASTVQVLEEKREEKPLRLADGSVGTCEVNLKVSLVTFRLEGQAGMVVLGQESKPLRRVS